ncbi:MAG: tyrosine-type recombinase/integrase [Cyanobacteria bacterium P01_D01_bin.44]
MSDTPKRAPRAPKGTVGIEVRDGWLRLRWTHQRKRYRMSLGLPDDAVSRRVAQQLADIIQGDIRAGQFDSTLARYRDDSGSSLTVVELFEKYCAHKRRQVGQLSMDKYRGATTHLERYFRKRQASALTERDCFDFRDHLLTQLAPITVRERLGLLRSAWDWAMQRKLVSGLNPWNGVKVKVAAKRKTVVSIETVRTIIAGAYEHYPHWAEYIEFEFCNGRRPGEAAGLQWHCLSEDCSIIWIGQSWGRERRIKPTKANTVREYRLSARMQGMLQQRRARLEPSGDDFVFTSPQGKPIDDQNFRKRCWKPLLEALEIDYFPFRKARHTFSTHAIDAGAKPSEVAAITGNSEETILRNYMGGVSGRGELPELFGDAFKEVESREDLL